MLKKIDITVSRDMTINTGNYSSIKPSITLTVKDVDQDKAPETYNKMSNILDTLMMFETISLSNEMESIQEMGYKKYKEMLQNASEAQGNNMTELLNKHFSEI